MTFDDKYVKILKMCEWSWPVEKLWKTPLLIQDNLRNGISLCFNDFVNPLFLKESKHDFGNDTVNENELDLIVISYIVFSEKTAFLISGHVQ